MLSWILSLSALCAASAAVVFGHVVPMASPVSSLCLAVCALSATLLIGSFEAYETRAVKVDRDDG